MAKTKPVAASPAASGSAATPPSASFASTWSWLAALARLRSAPDSVMIRSSEARALA
jgi:hypothetical protein